MAFDGAEVGRLALLAGATTAVPAYVTTTVSGESRREMPTIRVITNFRSDNSRARRVDCGHLVSGFMIEIGVLAVKVPSHISGLAAEFQFPLIGLKNPLLDVISALDADGVCDIGVQFWPAWAVVVRQVAVFVQPRAAPVAESGAEVVFFATARAAISQLARGHRQE
jgi:hypothetical protein